MTSTSRTKPRTTARITAAPLRVKIWREVLPAACCALGLFCGALVPAAAQDEPAPVAEAQQPSGLDRLKVRSPDARFKLLHESWKRTRPAPTPAPEPVADDDVGDAEVSDAEPAAEPVDVEEPSAPAEQAAVPAPLPGRRTPARIPNPPRRPLPTRAAPIDEYDSMAELQRAAQSDMQRYQEPERDPRNLKRIDKIEPFYIPPEPGQMPEEVPLKTEEYAGRHYPGVPMQWEATNQFHLPLYFQDENLERYGHAYPFYLQPAISITKFSGQLVSLPYAMTLNPPTKRMYTLGHYRPGDYVPYKYYQIPWNAKAVFNQAAVTTGMFYLIP